MTTPVSYNQLSPPWHNDPTRDSPLSANRFSYMDLGIVAQSRRIDSLNFNVIDFGAVGNGVRVFGAVASTGSATVTASAASFTNTDVGKLAVVYNDSAAGVVTTIQTVNSATSVTLVANAGITTTSGTGYILYGTDDSAAIQAALNAAATAYTTTANVNDPNQPIGAGRVTVYIPASAPHSAFLIASALTIPSGVELNCVGMLANMLASRNAYCVVVNPFAVVRRLEIENLFGTGVHCGTSGAQAHIYIGDLRVWHSNGSVTAPSGLGVVGSTTGGTLAAATRYYVVTAIDSSGGETLVSNEVSVVNTGTTSSNALTWTAFTGAASYRIYRGTATGAQSAYFTSGTNSYTDTGTTATNEYPIGPGCALRLDGFHYEINTLFLKIARLGVYHSAGSDTVVTSLYAVGCVTGVRCNGSNQLHYSCLLLDTCGGTGSLGGLILDNGCSNSVFHVQAFCVVGQSTALTPVVSIGPFSITKNVDLRLLVSAVSTGGSVVSVANASDLTIDAQCSNAGFPSSGGSNITTAVVYGTGLAGAMLIRSVLFASITPHTGSVSGIHQYLRNSTLYMAQAGGTPTLAALAANGTSPPAPTGTNANDARGTLNIGSGTGPTSGAQISVTPNAGAWVTAPTVILVPANAVTAALQPYVTAVTTTGFQVGFAVAPTASQSVGTYQVNYQTIG